MIIGVILFLREKSWSALNGSIGIVINNVSMVLKERFRLLKALQRIFLKAISVTTVNNHGICIAIFNIMLIVIP